MARKKNNNRNKNRDRNSNRDRIKGKKGQRKNLSKKDFRAKMKIGKNNQPKQADPVVDPVDLNTTETQLPETTPSFDYKGALAEMRAEFEERQRLADEKHARQVAEFEQGERTQMENQARAGQQTEYKLGSPSERMRGGTFGFRRRRKQQKMANRLMSGIGAVNSLAAGAGSAASGMLNF